LRARIYEGCWEDAAQLSVHFEVLVYIRTFEFATHEFLSQGERCKGASVDVVEETDMGFC